MTEQTNLSSMETSSVPKQMEKQLNKLEKKIVKDIESNKGFVRRLWDKFVNFFSIGPRIEIYHDWLTVHSQAEAAKGSLLREQDNNEVTMYILAVVQAYLTLARRERDFAQAWSYVNLADAHLPLIVDEKEIDNCLVRLRAADAHMTKESKERLDKLYSDFQKEIRRLRADSKNIEGREPSLNEILDQTSLQLKRFEKHSEQLHRATFWNIANRSVSLKFSLWRAVGFWLLMGLIIAITVAFQITPPSPPHIGMDLLKSFLTSPFLKIALLGFFGGGLSSFLTTRQAVVDVPNYQLVKIYILLRMLLGAAGAFVFYIIIQWPGLFDKSLLDLLSSNHYVFLTVGIMAGFSERLFIGTLEKMAEKLSVTGEAEEIKVTRSKQEKHIEHTDKQTSPGNQARPNQAMQVEH